MTNTYATMSSRTIYQGPIFKVRKDQVQMPGGAMAGRDVVNHLDAVAVVAMRDDGSIALIRQYRHPMGQHILELPAGLLDQEGENPVHTALRELREETGIEAAEMRHLCTIASSPGFCDELVEIYLATELTEGEREPGVHEEADIELSWVNLLDALAMIRDGRIISAHTVTGILAVIAEVYVDE